MITDRIDNITQIPPEYRVSDAPVPRSVKIELTGRCDFKCFFCATGQKLRAQSDMDFRFFERVTTEMHFAGVEELGLFYLGESFLYKRLEDAVRHASGLFPYVFLTTNGRLAGYERVHGIMKAGLDSLKFSFNWADKRQCRDVTQVDAFDRVVENIRNAALARDRVEAETGHRCNVYASSIQYDGDQQEKMGDAVDALRPYLDEHYWLPLYNQAGLTAGARGTVPVAGNVGRVGAIRPSLPCWAVFTEGHITFDGKLSACCFDHDGRFDMGDLNEMSFEEAWSSEKFRKLRSAHLAEDVAGTVCESCIAYG